MNPRSTLSLAVPLLTALFFPIAPASSYAFERIIDFETGNTSQLSQVNSAQYASIVPSTLPGGGNHAFRCMVPQGQREFYCGFNIMLNNMPEVWSNLYIRYYVKFEPSWRFATDSVYFKSQIIEVDSANYNAGGRGFINFNARNETTADIALLIYTDGQWHPTGVTISNNDQWHSIESRHLRNLSSPANGRVQFWFDGQLMVDLNPFNAGNANPAYLTFGYRNGSAQQDMYMQYDEVVIADHYIGPIGPGSSDRTPPTPPQNLTVR